MGRLVSIHISGAGGAPMQSVEAVRALPGRGLAGDRYLLGTGSYSEKPGTGRESTHIEREALQPRARELDLQVQPGLARRNLVTEGVALNRLVGCEFTVGRVRLRGIRLCEPCQGLAAATGLPSILPGLIHRGGLRCEILSEGELRVGDPIERAGS
jgi:MOSC domain-containing protein YiiM